MVIRQLTTFNKCCDQMSFHLVFSDVCENIRGHDFGDKAVSVQSHCSHSSIYKQDSYDKLIARSLIFEISLNIEILKEFNLNEQG